MYRDKDYLLTEDELIFNILGDQHAEGKITAGLKYVQGKKWIDTYPAAVAMLQASFPEYVDGRIQVPLAKVKKHLKPLDRTRQLLASSQPLPPLLATTLDLIHILADHCDVPASEIGVTDSLLWGEGNENSDIDLVIYGWDVCTRFLATSHELFQFGDIQFISPEFVQRPPHVDDITFQSMLTRKWNQGTYRATRFSIRGALTDEEVFATPERTQPFQPQEQVERELEISGNDESLFYPIAYETAEGIPLVSYHIGYEMGLQPGDRVKVIGRHETSDTSERLLVGSTGGKSESIRLLPA